LHIFGDVLGTNKQEVDVGVATVRLQDPFARLLGCDAARLEEQPRRFA
jgi:hypothetical protein